MSRTTPPAFLVQGTSAAYYAGADKLSTRLAAATKPLAIASAGAHQQDEKEMAVVATARLNAELMALLPPAIRSRDAEIPIFDEEFLREWEQELDETDIRNRHFCTIAVPSFLAFLGMAAVGIADTSGAFSDPTSAVKMRGFGIAFLGFCGSFLSVVVGVCLCGHSPTTERRARLALEKQKHLARQSPPD